MDGGCVVNNVSKRSVSATRNVAVKTGADRITSEAPLQVWVTCLIEHFQLSEERS